LSVFPPTSLPKHPKDLWILSLAELCERFALVGIGSLLVLFLIEYYHFSNSKAALLYGVFSGVATFLPLFGGWVADRWNYRSPILIGAILNAIGCFILATGTPASLYISLIVMSTGYGLFTPSLVTLLGHAYRDLPALREKGFTIYYAVINGGVTLALISIGSIAKWMSWQAAFVLAGLVQVLGLIPLIWYFLRHKETYRSLNAFQRKGFLEERSLSPFEKRRLVVIFTFFLVSIFFWVTYNQGYSSMAIFVHSYMNQRVLGFEVPEGVFLASVTFFLILLVPVTAFLYSWLQMRNKDPSPAKKISLSLFALAAAFLVMVFATYNIPAAATSANVSSGYIVSSYFLIAVGEMLLAPIGLSVVSRLSPPRYTALMVGIWYVCVGFAFFSGGMLASLMEKVGGLSHFFAFFVILNAILGLLMWLLSRKLTDLSTNEEGRSPHV